MEHLVIEQNNIQEPVTSAIITKLYEIAKSGDLRLTSNLKGSLYAQKAYGGEVDFLRGRFSELIITVDTRYKSFVDPYCKQFWANTPIGDGVGVTENAWNNITTNMMYRNANYFAIGVDRPSQYDIIRKIEHFPEMVDLPWKTSNGANSTTVFGGWDIPMFRYMESLKEIYYPRDVISASFNDVENDSIELIDTTTSDNLTDTVFNIRRASKLKKLIMHPSLTSVANGCLTGNGSGLDVFWYTTDLTNVISTTTWNFTNWTNVTFWVQDNVYNDWQNHPQFAARISNGTITLKRFSEYTGDDLVQKWLPTN